MIETRAERSRPPFIRRSRQSSLDGSQLEGLNFEIRKRQRREKLTINLNQAWAVSARGGRTIGNFVLCGVTVLLGWVWTAVAVADAPPTVTASAVEKPVAIDLAPESLASATGSWRFERNGSDRSVPAQVGVAVNSDGTPAENRRRVYAVIPPKASEAEQAWTLGNANGQATAPFSFTDISPESLQLSEGSNLVFVYNHGVITKSEIPESEHRRSRSCYIHPLYGLSGEVLTDDFPVDHYHHHGVFWTWPHVKIGEQQHDLWAGSTIRQKFIRWLVRETGPVVAVLAVENGWFVGDEQVMTERIWMRVYRAADNARAIDLEMFFTPLKPLSLQGAEGKSYGGLTVRFAPGKREETLITVPSGPTTEDLPDTPLAWADFTSRFGKQEQRSGAAIFVSPRHPDCPPTWLTRYYGAQCVGWPGVHARDFEAGVPFRLDYRLWIHRQAVEFKSLQDVYESYSQAVSLQ